MTLFSIVALSLAGLGVYCAYKNPKLGGAIVVGTAILTVLWLVTEKEASSPSQAPAPGASSPAPWAEPPRTLLPSPAHSAVPQTEPPGSPKT